MDDNARHSDAMGGWTSETLLRYFEAILEEQRRGMLVAAEEREKAASALRNELARAILEGDRGLRDHIVQQMNQLDASLVSAEKLEVQRIAECKAMITSVQREISIAFAASEKAIEKQEANAQEWRHGANEWRQQSAERERSQAQELATLSSTFIRSDTAEARFNAVRENADTQVTELRRQVSDLADKISKLV